MWEKVTPYLQLIGAALAIPAAPGGTYSVYRNFFATDVACHNLQVAIISVMEKNVPPDVKRGLLIKDVTEFDQKCSRIDPNSHAIFQAAVRPPRPEPPASTQLATAEPGSAPAPAARTGGVAASPASTFGRSASGDVRGWVCAVERRRFPVGASPTRRPLQPEAIGAVMEVTKWLKPSISVSRIGDSASVQAATRVNAEQASKRTMRRPTRQPFRGRLVRLGE